MRRYLRIATTVVGGTLCLLLVALWVRSYLWRTKSVNSAIILRTSIATSSSDAGCVISWKGRPSSFQLSTYYRGEAGLHADEPGPTTNAGAAGRSKLRSKLESLYWLLLLANGNVRRRPVDSMVKAIQPPHPANRHDAALGIARNYRGYEVRQYLSPRWLTARSTYRMMAPSSRILGQQPHLGFSRATNQEVWVWRPDTPRVIAVETPSGGWQRQTHWCRSDHWAGSFRRCAFAFALQF